LSGLEGGIEGSGCGKGRFDSGRDSSGLEGGIEGSGCSKGRFNSRRDSSGLEGGIEGLGRSKGRFDSRRDSSGLGGILGSGRDLNRLRGETVSSGHDIEGRVLTVARFL
jgi:hypothetical protein